MTVAVPKSSDPGAPTLNNVAGAMIAVLDFILLPLGWTKVYTATNKAVYRAGAGNRHYLRVDDTDIVTTRIVGYESMSDVDTGVNAFPTAAQLAGGLYVSKATGANLSLARPWIAVVSNRGFYLAVESSSTVAYGAATQTSANQRCMFFGEFTSFKPGDQFNTMIVGEVSAATGQTMRLSEYSTPGALQGHYVARAATQAVGAIQVGKHSHPHNPTQSGVSTTAPGYPDPVQGAMLMSQVFITEGSAAAQATRGVMPGLWNLCHQLPAANLDTYDGSGVLAGKSFLLLNGSASNVASRYALETSSTW